MRYQGRISEWKDDRGFGFVVQNGGGEKVFIHISSFSRRDQRPTVGSLVTYEIAIGDNGRAQAKNAQFVTDRRSSARPQSSSIISNFATLLILGFTAYIVYSGYMGYERRAQSDGAEPAVNVVVPASVNEVEVVPVRDVVRENSRFQCDPAKSSCSRMSSCEEATFHQERCGVTGMDGDHDGIPCELQWCN